jgi:hypothetical protein
MPTQPSPSSPVPVSDRPKHSVFPTVIFVVMLVAALWSWSLSWHEPILDRHEFRQVQTAISSYWMYEAGWKLDYETPLFGPPWSLPMEFPVYQTCVAALCYGFGLPLESAGRATSILFLLLTLPAVYQLAGIFKLSPSRRLLVVAAVISSPVYLFYGRTFMMETTALCFSTWFLLGIGFTSRDVNYRWSLVATVAGGLAALAKVTTFAVFCFPAGGLALWLAWPRLFGGERNVVNWLKTSLLCVIPVIISLSVGSWWVSYADAIKDSNPYSGFLTSTQMVKWNWGTFDQRFSLEFWAAVWSNVTQFVISEHAMVLLLVCATLATQIYRRFFAASIMAFLVGPLVFSSLYFHHDYYYSANALLLLMGAGVLLASLWDSTIIARPAKTVIVILFFSTQLLIFYRGYAFNHRRELPQPPEIAAAIKATTSPEDVILFYGWDWNALIPYYAQRRSLMVPSGRDYDLAALEDILSRLPPRKIRGMIIRTSVIPASPEFIANRSERFGLSSVPVATSPDGDLYLSSDLAGEAVDKLNKQTFNQVKINTHHREMTEPVILKEADPYDLDLPFLNPRPSHAQSQFGLKPAVVEGVNVLLTHPRTHLFFPITQNNTKVRILVGISRDAFNANDPSATDGITVELAIIPAGGVRRVVMSRDLNPRKKERDRGIQEITLDKFDPIVGELEIYLSPGLLGNLSNDWAFISEVTIK